MGNGTESFAMTERKVVVPMSPGKVESFDGISVLTSYRLSGCVM